MIIAVEGMDGVGKTEISTYLSKEYGLKIIEKPLHYFYNDDKENGYSDMMKTCGKLYDIDDSVLKTLYFLLGNTYAVRMFKDQDIVLDRHLVSTYYWNGTSESEKIYSTVIDAIGKPDLTILLYASTKTRMERLKKRNEKDPDLLDPEKKDNDYDKMISFLERYDFPYIIVNTENKSIEEVELEVFLEMEKLLKQQKEEKTLIKKYKNKSCF